MIDAREKSAFPGVIRHASCRIVAMLSVVIAVLGFNFFTISTSSADAFWTNAIEIPGLATLNQTLSGPGPIVCTSSGNCVSGGVFTDSLNNDEAFLSQETNGVWSKAVEVATALNVGGFANVTAISCPVAGSCTAVGDYSDSNATEHTFVMSQTNGTWGIPTEVPDFTTLAFQDGSVMNVLSCTSASSCVGVGNYQDHATSVSQPIIFTETNGVWAAPVAATGAASLNPIGETLVVALDCPSATTCTAAGDFLSLNSTNPYLTPFLIEDNNGVWSSVQTVPGAAALTRIPDAGLVALSCGAPGDCSGAGIYADAVGQLQAFIVNEVGGVWGSATQLLATQTLGSGLTNSLNGIVCPSAGNCSAIGAYADSQGISQPFVIDERNHVWNPAIEVPGLQALNNSAGATLNSISCSAVGVCSAGGTYTDASTNDQAFLVNESGSTWSTPIEVPGTSSLNKGGRAAVSEVSCSSDGSCGVQGLYTDGKKNTQLFVVNSSAIAPTSVSTAPRNVTAVDKKGVITVRWSAPESNGGAAITSYTVVSLPKSKTCVTLATSCKFKGLNKKVHYSFEVRATNADGSSVLSAKSNAVRAS
jgi:hypothetical protein